MVIGGALAVLPVLFKKLTYTSSASFIPEGGDNPAASGLAGIAGRFGISLGSAGAAGQSPQFYSQLLKSRSILAPIVTDTFTVPELGATPRTLLDILDIKADNPAKRTTRGIVALDQIIGQSISDRTGIMTITATTEWPSLSQQIAKRLLVRLNEFNLHTRQRQAGEERRFTEDRLRQAQAALNTAEERLLSFVQSNRSFQSSSELSVQRDRLTREVQLQQSVVGTLAQSYEEIRMREVRDTPVITVIEEPSPPADPNPRGRVKRGLLGIVLGGLFGALFVVVSDALHRKRNASDADATTFFEAVGELQAALPRVGRRSKTQETSS
jgi:uncharacterized protein involved in exopolysaccharide biosynthesis